MFLSCDQILAGDQIPFMRYLVTNLLWEPTLLKGENSIEVMEHQNGSTRGR